MRTSTGTQTLTCGFVYVVIRRYDIQQQQGKQIHRKYCIICSLAQATFVTNTNDTKVEYLRHTEIDAVLLWMEPQSDGTNNNNRNEIQAIFGCNRDFVYISFIDFGFIVIVAFRIVYLQFPMIQMYRNDNNECLFMCFGNGDYFFGVLW